MNEEYILFGLLAIPISIGISIIIATIIYNLNYFLANRNKEKKERYDDFQKTLLDKTKGSTIRKAWTTEHNNSKAKCRAGWVSKTMRKNSFLDGVSWALDIMTSQHGSDVELKDALKELSESERDYVIQSLKENGLDRTKKALQFLELPEDLNTELGVYSLRNQFNDKRKAIIKILQEKLLKNGGSHE